MTLRAVSLRRLLLLCFLTSLTFLAFAIPPGISTSHGPQLSPGLVLLSHSRTLLRPLEPLLFWQKTAEKKKVRLLVEFRGHARLLRESGMTVTGGVGAFHTGWLDIDRVQKLVRLRGLQAAELSRRLKPHLNVSAPLIAAPQTRLKLGLDGRGVIIGIIDTGLDLEHPAFLHKDGTTRLLALVDYSIGVNDKDKPFSPRVFLPAELNQAAKDKKPTGHQDSIGHGTHIAGIAAGNGQTGSSVLVPRYLGIAPRADLIVVKGTREGRGDFDSGDVLESIGFIHRWAKKVKKPYVINISLGGHQGGHDGTSLLERAIDSFSGKGKAGQAIVVSAGNEGSRDMHASGWIRPGSISDVDVLLPKPKEGKDNHGKATVQIELWLPYDGYLKVSVLVPNGQKTPFVSIRQKEPSSFKTEMGEVTILAGRQSRFPYSHRLVVLLSGTKEEGLSAGVWKLRLSGSTSRFDAWIADSSLSKGRAVFSSHVTSEMLIGVPGSARGAITVGSFNSRVGWLNTYQENVQKDLPLGAVSSFSSPGPTRDGRFKPEITAPGLFIASAMASTLNDLSSSVVADGPYIVSQGTSQAAPHVAGALAMLLQWKPDMDVEQLRRLLTLTADGVSAKGGSFHRLNGYGKLHVGLAAQAMQGNVGKEVDVQHSTLGSLYQEIPADGKSRTTLVVIPKDSKGLPLASGQKVEFNVSTGFLTTPIERIAGIVEVGLIAPSTPGKVRVRAKVNGRWLKRELSLSFVPAAAPPEEGCSCQSLPLSGGGMAGIWWLGLLWFLRRKKRGVSS
jgi:subtilisin family serine protease